MDNQWPPKTVEVKRHFEKAHEARNDNVPPPLPPPPLPPVSKPEIDKLRGERPPPLPSFNPTGAKPNDQAQKDWERRLAKMQARLDRMKDKARDDFNKEKGRDR